MARYLSSLLAALLCACSSPPAALPPRSAPAASDVDLRSHFEGFTGCFVMLDVGTGQLTRYNPPQCAKRLSPCSTFKIPNSLIALETSVVSGPDHVLMWDGVKRSREALNRDHDLRSAMSNSVLWYYQEVARHIGARRMQSFLDKFEYGNRDISGGIDQFWLGSTLTISADEQIEFLRKMLAGHLPLSKRSIDIVKEITVNSWSGSGELHGKTGSQGAGERGILGWYVGWIESEGRTVIFACNIQGDDGASGLKARSIAQAILAEQLAPAR